MRFDAWCARNGGELLRHDTSTDAARNMNLLRQAVGAGKLNCLGLSYATGIGVIYANLFPATVGHMVLDGNLDPVTWSEGGMLPDALREDADLAAAATMRSFLDLCGATSTAGCAFSAGTTAATRAKFSTLLRRLLKHPVTTGTPPRTFTYADAVSDVPPRDVSDWQSAAVLLQRLWAASAEGVARARLLTVDGYGHTEFFNPSTCATNDEVGYLETGTLPPPGTVCQQDIPPFPAP